MVEFHGRPFLEYMIEMLREQGFERVLLLLGYLPEVIQDHFGDGSGFGVEIDYSVSGPDDLTVSRIQLVERPARRQLPARCTATTTGRCDMDDMWQQFQRARRAGHGHGVRQPRRLPRRQGQRARGGRVRRPRSTRRRTTPGLQGVEISYAILTRPVLDLLPEEDELIEVALYPQLAEAARAGGLRDRPPLLQRRARSSACRSPSASWRAGPR